MNLTTQKSRVGLAQKIMSEIDQHCVDIYDDGHRNHLGASIIGRDCNRELWYTFRHVHHKVFDGRMYRLFNRGHKEEDRFVEWLRGIGCEVQQHDENGKQFKISDVEGHFGGSTDGIITLPESWGFDESLLLEFKTHKDSGFGQFAKTGVQVVKPEHFDQMCVYGYKKGLRYALYMVVNKNNDIIYTEVIELDWERAKELIGKAEYIINLQVAPDRLSNSSAHYKCKLCDYRGICHKGEEVEKNCRSCGQSKPVKNAQWYCDRWSSIIPKENIKDACGKWRSICLS